MFFLAVEEKTTLQTALKRLGKTRGNVENSASKVGKLDQHVI